MVALLDVNFLVALFDGIHVHHEVAHDWLAVKNSGRLATFDRSIALSSVAGANADHIELISLATEE